MKEFRRLSEEVEEIFLIGITLDLASGVFLFAHNVVN